MPQPLQHSMTQPHVQLNLAKCGVQEPWPWSHRCRPPPHLSKCRPVGLDAYMAASAHDIHATPCRTTPQIRPWTCWRVASCALGAPWGPRELHQRRRRSHCGGDIDHGYAQKKPPLSVLLEENAMLILHGKRRRDYMRRIRCRWRACSGGGAVLDRGWLTQQDQYGEDGAPQRRWSSKRWELNAQWHHVQVSLFSSSNLQLLVFYFSSSFRSMRNMMLWFYRILIL